MQERGGGERGGKRGIMGRDPLYQGTEAHDQQLRTPQENNPYGANRPAFDFSLKEAKLGLSLILIGTEFQTLGAMLLIDLQSE